MGTVQAVFLAEGDDPPADRDERTSFEKAVDRAFDYHPYGFDGVKLFGEWIVGPTFIVRTDGPERYRPRKQKTIFHPSAQWQLIATSLISQGRSAKLRLDVRDEGHNKKPTEVSIKDEKGNRAKTMRPGGKCTGRAIYIGQGAWKELAYPLYALGKKLGVESYWALDAHTNVIFGFSKEKRLLAIFSPRGIENCDLR